jgi:hypothetical protein
MDGAAADGSGDRRRAGRRAGGAGRRLPRRVLDPEPYAAGDAVTEILAAHAGFLLTGGLTAEQPSPAAAQGLAAIAAAKLHLGLGALRWLRRRR